MGMEIHLATSFLTPTRQSNQNLSAENSSSNTQTDTGESFDPTGLWVMQPNYDQNAGTYYTYDKNGNMIDMLHVGVDSQQDYKNIIAKSVDPSYMSPATNTTKVSTEPETLEQFIEESDINSNVASDTSSQSTLYDANQTPIADQLDSYLKTLVNSGIGSGQELSNVDPDALSKTVIAYDKAKTEIEDTYSDKNIQSRAKSLGVTDLKSYTNDQLQLKQKELSNLNQYYEQDTAWNIGEYTSSLQDTLGNGDAYDATSGSSEAEGAQVANLTNELSSLYTQFKAQNNVDYSTESVDEIASQFSSYGLDNAKTTVDVGGTSFTYKDIHTANELLNSLKSTAPADWNTNASALQAALGYSEVSYVANNQMTQAAGEQFLNIYNKQMQNGANQVYEQFSDNKYLSGMYSGFKNLNTSNAESYVNSFNNIIRSYQYSAKDNGYESIQQTFQAFTELFI